MKLLPRITLPRRLTGELSLTPEMCEAVLTEYERENPGKRAFPDMGADEFTSRVIAKLRASGARILPDASVFTELSHTRTTGEPR